MDMDLCSPKTIAYIKKKYGFRFTKSLGQNFLIDRNVVEGIADAVGAGPEDLVVEIGPGIGTLTKELSARSGKVVSIEIDKGLIPVLQETLAGADNVSILPADVLKIDINDVIREHPECSRVMIVGNLPYYITTPIIMDILEKNVKADSMVFMMQKEVAVRIGASPGKKDIGAISYAVQYRCNVETVMDVPKGAFMPAPKVDSRVIRLMPMDEPAVNVRNEKVLFECVKNGFGQRRKTLVNSLTGTCGKDKEAIKSALENCGIDPARRAETLTIEEFGRIADELVQADES